MLYGGEPASRQPDPINSQDGLWRAIDAMSDHVVCDTLLSDHPYGACRVSALKLAEQSDWQSANYYNALKNGDVKLAIAYSKNAPTPQDLTTGTALHCAVQGATLPYCGVCRLAAALFASHGAWSMDAYTTALNNGDNGLAALIAKNAPPAACQ